MSGSGGEEEEEEEEKGCGLEGGESHGDDGDDGYNVQSDLIGRICQLLVPPVLYSRFSIMNHKPFT